jgi:light-regulated signal transduction histidine kinase (bacteriophytochrome)
MGELTGLPVSRLLHTDEHERLEMLELYRPDGTRITRPEELPLSKTVNDGRYYKDYVAELKTDGASRILSANSAPIRDAEGAIIGAIGVWRDVTQTRRYEEALRSRTEELAAVNREMETFSYSVSHDLRGPLHTIKGFADFLVEDYREQLGDEGAECLRHIESGVDKMTGLIDDMLRLSRVGRSEIKREEVDLSVMVEAFLYELRQDDPERAVQCTVQPDLRAHVDPGLMGLAIQNLLNNAWKFTAHCEVARIEFGAVSEAAKPTFYVADNGAGFDMQFAKSIFEPFRRLHAEKEYNGSGIGLSIVRRAIERHGGAIWAEGEPGRGARFFFTLS